MKTIELKNALPLSIFSHEMIYSLLEKSISNVNEKISNLVRNKELIRLKKGFYTFSKLYQTKPINLISVANTLYSPSYCNLYLSLSFAPCVDIATTLFLGMPSKQNSKLLSSDQVTDGATFNPISCHARPMYLLR